MGQENLNGAQNVAENGNIEQEQLSTSISETDTSSSNGVQSYVTKALKMVWKIIKWILSFIIKVIGGALKSVGGDMQHHKKK